MTCAGTQHRVAALAHGQRPGHLRMLKLTDLGMLAVVAGQPTPAHVDAWSRTDRVRGASSAAPRLTAKLTAKPPDTRDPQGMTMDACIRPELRRCARR
jgi:hypothetical protein